VTVSAGRHKHRIATAVQAICFFFGLAALGYWGYSTFEAKAVQAYEEWAFSEELAGREPSVAGYLGSFIGLAPRTDHWKPPVKPEISRPEPPPPVLNKEWRARIRIPRVHVEAVVQHGVDERTLRRAVGHIPGTAVPGQSGNVGLAAHRDTFFRGLRHIRKDDRIIVQTREGVFHYEVDSTRIVSPSRVDVLDATAEPTLTLVTCYPFNYVGKAPKRFIVHARQITPSPVQLRGS
jgi:LPXTG-site transpeptidase (sortase) family protein